MNRRGRIRSTLSLACLTCRLNLTPYCAKHSPRTGHCRKLCVGVYDPRPHCQSALGLFQLTLTAYDGRVCLSSCSIRCLADGLNLQDSVAKLLVDYVDALLRKGGLPEPPEESEIEGRLDDLIALYASSPRCSVQSHNLLLELVAAVCQSACTTHVCHILQICAPEG